MRESKECCKVCNDYWIVEGFDCSDDCKKYKEGKSLFVNEVTISKNIGGN